MKGLILPKLPEKHGISKSISNLLYEDEKFINQRKNVVFFIFFLLIFYKNIKKDLENYLKKLIEHPIFSKDMVLKFYLCFSVEEFKIFQKKNHKMKEKNGIYENNAFEEMSKLYEYAQAYIKTSFSSTLMKNKSYETTEIDVLMEKVKNYEESLVNLIAILADLAKLEHNNSHTNTQSLLLCFSDGYFFEGIEKWNQFLNSEQNLFEVNFLFNK